jgi:hypothetical protein
MKNVSASIPGTIWRSCKQRIFDAQAEGTEMKTWDMLITRALESFLSPKTEKQPATRTVVESGVIEAIDQQLANGLRRVFCLNPEASAKVLESLRAFVEHQTKGK